MITSWYLTRPITVRRAGYQPGHVPVTLQLYCAAKLSVLAMALSFLCSACEHAVQPIVCVTH